MPTFPSCPTLAETIEWSIPEPLVAPQLRGQLVTLAGVLLGWPRDRSGAALVPEPRPESALWRVDERAVLKLKDTEAFRSWQLASTACSEHLGLARLGTSLCGGVCRPDVRFLASLGRAARRLHRAGSGYLFHHLFHRVGHRLFSGNEA